MVFLEYHEITGQVVQIYDAETLPEKGYAIARSDLFSIGDEFERNITINEVDENKNLLSYSAIRNNPNANRLLRENVELKQETSAMRIQSAKSNAELFELVLKMSGGFA